MNLSRELDGGYSWVRLALAVLLATLGGAGMWSVVVVLPAVQAEFGSGRGAVSLAYTLTMIGFAAGGVLMGKLFDRFGAFAPLLLGSVTMSAGFVLAGFAHDLTQFALVQGVMIAGLGSAAMFGPLMADVSRWFQRRRGMAVGLCASGNYFAGAIWPTAMQPFLDTLGWRGTYIGIGIVCFATMVPLALMMRPRPPFESAASAAAAAAAAPGYRLGLSPAAIQNLLVVAGFACCVAMAMPQVHIVAYCADLGYGPARGAEMLSLMFACGIVSRIGSGFLADRIGGLATLMIGSTLQMAMLCLYLLFDSLTSLFVITALFGLFQGGIVPSYAIVARALFPAAEAGVRVGVVLMSTLVGMAAGGWMSGAIFDAMGSYGAAFVNGISWNLLNLSIVGWLLLRTRRLTRDSRAQPQT